MISACHKQIPQFRLQLNPRLNLQLNSQLNLQFSPRLRLSQLTPIHIIYVKKGMVGQNVRNAILMYMSTTILWVIQQIIMQNIIMKTTRAPTQFRLYVIRILPIFGGVIVTTTTQTQGDVKIKVAIAGTWP